MKILLVTAGSRGDVEPFVTFAHHAISAGHTVRLALPDNSGAITTGLDVVSLGVDYSALIEDQGVSVRAAMRSFTEVIKPIMRGVIVTTVTIALEFEPDVILYHPKVLSAPIAADRLGIPHIVVELVPVVTPTSAFAAPGTTTANLGVLNRVTFRAVAASGSMFSAELREARSIAGVVTSRMSPPTSSLVPISPAILERPADWPAHVHLTGAWSHQHSHTALDSELQAFLDGGPFIYAGFGSMARGNAHKRGRAIVDAARQVGARILVATGLGGIAIDDALAGDDVFVTRSVDHTAVLPLATAAIHHGGVGTVHAAARAGTPSIIVPFLADQPFWGAYLHRHGLSPAPIAEKSLTAARLTTALESASAYSEQARRIATIMSRENGLDTAIHIVERTVER
jgi:sterol 3beta-glucosyltransferase